MNEILFWKVFNNKIIFNKIINEILNQDITNEYYDYKQINVYNRIQFKYISTFGFMIQSRLFSLIKLKIENDDEHLNFLDPHSKRIFFTMIHKSSPLTSNNNNNNNNFYNENYQIGDEIIFIDILKLLMNSKKRKYFENYDLIKLSIYYQNIYSLEFLLNQYRFQVLPSVVLLSFSSPNSNLEIIKLIIQSPTTIINNHVKNNLLSSILNNTSTTIIQKQEILKFILDSNLLALVNCTSEKGERECGDVIHLKKKLKLSEEQEEEDEEELNLVKIEISKLLELNELSLQIRLFKLNCFKIENQDYHLFLSNYFKESNIDLLLMRAKVFSFFTGFNEIQLKVNEIYNKEFKDNEIKLKEIRKSIIITLNNYKKLTLESKTNLYIMYLEIYDEPILESSLGEIGDHIVYKHCFYNSFSSNLLKYLLDKNYDIFNSQFDKKNNKNSEILFIDHSSIFNKYPNNVVEFIKLYSSRIGSNGDSTKIKYQEILNLLFCKSNSEKWFNELIEIPFFKNIIINTMGIKISKWDKLLPTLMCWNIYRDDLEKPIIDDFKSIDLISDFISSNKNNDQNKVPAHNAFRYQSIDLLNYGYSKLTLGYSSNKHIKIENYNYSYPLEFAISTCNIELLSKLDKHCGDDNIKLDCNIDGFKVKEIDQIKLMIKYLNETGYKIFSVNLFKTFINLIIDYSRENSIDFHQVFKINFDNFTNVKSNLIQDIFQNLNNIQKDDQNQVYYDHNSILFYLDCDIGSSNEKLNLFQNHDNGGNNFEFSEIENGLIKYSNQFKNLKEIIPIFEYWINKSKTNTNISKESYQIIFNYLFDLLLSIKYITIDQVLNFINNYKNIIQFKNSHRISVRCLTIRSPKLSKYIFETKFENFKLLDPTIFTINQIFNLPFDELLYKLFKFLSIDLNLKKLSNFGQDYFTISINNDLSYFLNIKRVDLFFKLLNYIKDKIEEYKLDHSNEIGNFPDLSNMGMFLSPIHSIKSTSIHYNEIENQLKKPTFIENQESPIEYPTFEFRKDVLQHLVRVLNNDQIQQFLNIPFVSHIEELHLKLFEYSIQCNRIEIASWLIENYNIYFSGTSWFDLFSDVNQFKSISFLLKNHLNDLINSNGTTKEGDSIDQDIIYSKKSKSHQLFFIFQRLLPFIFKRKSNNQLYLDFINQSTRQSTILKILNLKNYQKLLDLSVFPDVNVEDDEELDGEYEEAEDEEEDNKDGEADAEEEYEEISEYEEAEDEQEEDDENDETLFISKIEEELQFSKIIDILFENETIKMIDKISSDLIDYEVQQKQQQQQAQHDCNIFNISFKNGNIELCDLILKSFPNRFKITKELIIHSIQFERIEILKYYFENGGITGTESEFTIKTLKNHKNYKYLNWL